MSKSSIFLAILFQKVCKSGIAHRTPKTSRTHAHLTHFSEWILHAHAHVPPQLIPWILGLLHVIERKRLMMEWNPKINKLEISAENKMIFVRCQSMEHTKGTVEKEFEVGTSLSKVVECYCSSSSRRTFVVFKQNLGYGHHNRRSFGQWGSQNRIFGPGPISVF